MKKLPVVLTLPLAAVLVACGASSEDIRDAKSDAKARGFMVLSTTTYDMESMVRVDVSFGGGGCTGTINYEDGNSTLGIELPIPGTTTETEYTEVDDPRVNDLELNPAFKHCFTGPNEKPKS